MITPYQRLNGLGDAIMRLPLFLECSIKKTERSLFQIFPEKQRSQIPEIKTSILSPKTVRNLLIMIVKCRKAHLFANYK